MAYRGIVGRMPPLDHMEMPASPMDAMQADDGMPDMSHEDLAQSVAHHKAMPIHHARRVVSNMMHPKMRHNSGVRIGRKTY